MQEKVLLPKFIPELDGLRAFAILPVLLFHLHFPGFSLGWSGVFLFFVISGFLITGILLDSKKKPHYYKNFYIRRTLRIFPIYYLCFFAVLIVSRITEKPNSDYLWYLTYVQNYVLGIKNFGTQFSPAFSHTWTLAIEEQFYFLWPFLVYIFSTRRLLYLLFGFIATAITCRIGMWVYFANPHLVYTALPSVIDSLSIGAILAIIIRMPISRNELIKKTCFVLGISFVFLAVIIGYSGLSSYWSPGTTFPGKPLNLLLYTVMSVFFGSLIGIAIFTNTQFSKLLRTRWLGHIGKISYGLYLYHMPVYIYLDLLINNLCPSWQTEYSVVVIIIKLALTYVISIFSYHFIEAFFLKLKDKFSYKQSFMEISLPNKQTDLL